ncbi:MAG TPA: hypothetical protein VF744_00150 [Beijerinckiaceae bacterium]|jgi:hypothetical protein
MRVSARASLAALGLALAGCVTSALPTIPTAHDVAGELEFGGPGRGAVVYRSRTSDLCSQEGLTVTKEDQPEVSTRKVNSGIRPLRIHNYIYNEQNMHGLTLPAGAYVVDAVACTMGRTRRIMNGVVARFTVREGEVVKLGVIEFTFARAGLFTREGTLSFAVRPFNADEEEYFRRRLPGTSAKAVARTMTPVEPFTRQMR